jgi:hypothetical protein
VGLARCTWASGGSLLSQLELIVALAVRHRIPAIYTWHEAAAAGGLMTYSPSITDVYRQAGSGRSLLAGRAKPGTHAYAQAVPESDCCRRDRRGAVRGNAWSQTSRTVKFVVPFPAGGGADLLMRGGVLFWESGR